MKPNAGFTLLELLVAIAIIGILSAVILASLNSAREKGRVAAAQSQLEQIERAIQLLFTDTGFYPSGHASPQTVICDTPLLGTNEIALSDPAAGLVSNGGSWPGWSGPYIKVPMDPWGGEYYIDSDYACSPEVLGCRGRDDGGLGASVVLVSCGPDQSIAGRSCAYNSDNIVFRMCDANVIAP